jgi:choice-of-anchor A domain-containing protein
MIRLSVLFAASALALVPATGTAMAAQTTARDYNVLVLNDFSATSSDVEGWVAAGGSINVSHYSIGDKKPAGAGQYAAVAGQNFNGGGGTVYGSSLASSYSGSFSYTGGSAQTYAGGNASPIDVAGEIARLGTLSDDLYGNASSYGTIGSYQLMYNQLFLVGADDQVNVFNISAADWANTRYGWHLAIKPGSLAIFNIAGTDVGIANSGSDNGTFNGQNVGFAPQAYDASRVLYNFYDATRIAPAGSVNATILAPNADFESTYGVVLGQVFAKSFSGNIQVNNVNFQGTDILDHDFDAVPEPASWAMMIAGFAAAGMALRRRRPARAAIA